MRVLDLFSGIGGFSLGLEKAGMETVAFCEIEDYPVSILKKHWPDVPIYDDIRRLTGEQIIKEVGEIDVVCGGFPCQPFSVAGKQLGKSDNRHLWPEMFRLIQELRPRWVIGENVAGLVRVALDDVLSNLEGEDYTCRTFSIPACGVGAIHRRERLWILANTEHAGWGSASQQGGNQPSVLYSTQGSDETSESEGICISEAVANTERQGLQGQPKSDNISRERPASAGSGAESSFQFLCTGGFRPISVPAQHPLCHRDDGVSDRVARLKALGNAVVPQIPELIGRCIMEIDKK